MKKIAITLSLCAFSGLTIKAQTGENTANPIAQTPASLAEIKFDAELHDFGTIAYAGNGTYEFKFKNTGKEPLIITDAQGSCGCTVPT